MAWPSVLLRPGRTCACGPPVWQLCRPLSTSSPAAASLLFFSASVSPAARRPAPGSPRLLSASLCPSVKPCLRTRMPSRLALWAIPCRTAATSSTKPTRLYPERLLIYHAGTPRTTFLACLKVTTLFGLAFFTFLIGPSYIASGKPWLEALGVAACGIIPFALVAYTSHPFVAFVHLRLPPFARHPDRNLLRKFVHGLPPSTTLLDMTTMNLVGRPRVTTVTVGDLVPRKETLRIVNLVDRRTQTMERGKGGFRGLRRSSQFPWVTLPPVTHFGAPVGGNSRGTREGWAWTDIMAGIERRAAEEGEAAKAKAKAGPSGPLSSQSKSMNSQQPQPKQPPRTLKR